MRRFCLEMQQKLISWGKVWLVRYKNGECYRPTFDKMGWMWQRELWG